MIGLASPDSQNCRLFYECHDMGWLPTIVLSESEVEVVDGSSSRFLNGTMAKEKSESSFPPRDSSLLLFHFSLVPLQKLNRGGLPFFLRQDLRGRRWERPY